MSVCPQHEPSGGPTWPGDDASPGPVARAQLARLLRMVFLLQSERCPNARELSEHCEVSRRTTYRDLDVLDAAGFRVFFRQDRRGYQLDRGLFLPPPNLTETEALGLLALTRLARSPGDGLGLEDDARAAALKVVQTLPADVRDRVLAATEPVEPEGESAGLTPERRAVRVAVLRGLFDQRQVRLWLRDPDHPGRAHAGDGPSTKFGTYRIVRDAWQWVLVGRSSVVRRVEVIALPSIDRAELTNDRYVIPPRFQLARALARAGPGPGWDDVCLLCTRRAAQGLADDPGSGFHSRLELPDGRVEVHLLVDGLDGVTRTVLAWIDEVEVVAPRELRDLVPEAAARIARLYGPGL